MFPYYSRVDEIKTWSIDDQEFVGVGYKMNRYYWNNAYAVSSREFQDVLALESDGPYPSPSSQ